MDSEKINQLKENLKDFKDKYFDGRELVLISYNELQDSMMLGDDMSLKAYLDKLDGVHNPVVLIYGNGGNLYTGFKMSYVLRKKFNKYDICVPLFAFSSMCYLVFKANQLLLTYRSALGQIDPIIRQKGLDDEQSRLINNVGENNKLNKSNEFVNMQLNLTRDKFLSMLKEQPSIFNKKEADDKGIREPELLEAIIDTFLCGEKHWSLLTYSHLKDLKCFNIKNLSKSDDFSEEDFTNDFEKIIGVVQSIFSDVDGSNLLITSTKQITDYEEMC